MKMLLPQKMLLPLLLAAPLAAQTAAPAAASAAKPAVPPSLGAPAAEPISPAKLAKVEQLITLLSVDTQTKSMLSNTKLTVHQIATRQEAAAKNDAQKTLVADFTTQMDAAANELLVWEPVHEALVQAYAKNYTDADLTSSIAFFGSQEGKDFLAKSPMISQEVDSAQRVNITKLRERIQQLSQDFATKMKAAAPLTLQPLDPPATGTTPSKE